MLIKLLSIFVSLLLLGDRLNIGYDNNTARQEFEISLNYEFNKFQIGSYYTFDHTRFPQKYTRVNELGYLYYQVPIKNFYIYNSYGIGSTWDIEILFGYKYKKIEIRTGVGRLDRLILELRINLLD